MTEPLKPRPRVSDHTSVPVVPVCSQTVSTESSPSQVTGQVIHSLSSPSPTSQPLTPLSQPRPRAKIDLSSLGLGPTKPSRPNLRNHASTSSLRSPVVHSSADQGAPPVPALPSAHVRSRTVVTSTANSASASLSGRSSPFKRDASSSPLKQETINPVTRVRSNTLSKGNQASTSSTSKSNTENISTQPPRNASRSRPATGDTTRARVRPGPSTPSPSEPITSSRSLPGAANSPLLSPPLNGPVARSPSPTKSLLSEITSRSAKSSPRTTFTSLSSDPLMNMASAHHKQHPTCPVTPLADASPQLSVGTKHRKMPVNPAVHHPPHFPLPPHSPQLRLVDLPLLTPFQTPTDWNKSLPPAAGSASGSELGYRSAVVEVQQVSIDDDTSSAISDELENPDVNVVLNAEVDEAKINRKIADLEISNASLLAINKSLEATKARQRAEILKLRRALRDSLGGPPIPSLPSSPNITESHPSIMSIVADEEGNDSFDNDMVDPQIEARWERIISMVDGMKQRGQRAVERGKEEVRIAGQRVLGWVEVNEEGSPVGDTGTPEPEPETNRNVEEK
ncbi:hypothetical protein M231_03844 [Tremella mesenterica]|uniref:Uncharacterized protein n=1 Tax=Tremella mesenterica TaxID=5217 RepID=A0A4Q1BM55_TREME|nr:hypothetical protein M231_03844 [Tremella mesenterica]